MYSIKGLFSWLDWLEIGDCSVMSDCLLKRLLRVCSEGYLVALDGSSPWPLLHCRKLIVGFPHTLTVVSTT